MSRLVAIGGPATDPSAREGAAGPVLWYARAALDPERDTLAALTELGPEAGRTLATLFAAGIGIAGMPPGSDAIGAPADGAWHRRCGPRSLSGDPAALAAALAGADLIYLGAGTLAGLAQRPRRQLVEGLAAARGAGARIAFGTAPGPDCPPCSDELRAVVTGMAGRADIVLSGFDAEARLFGDSDPRASLDRYIAAGAGEVAVSDGRGGVLLSEGRAMSAGGAAAAEAWPGFDGFYLGARLAGSAPRAAAKAALALAGRVAAAPLGAPDLPELHGWGPDRANAGSREACRFARETVPRWLDHALAPGEGPAAVMEGFEETGRRTSLVQCRAIFTLAHLGRATGDGSLVEAAGRVHRFASAYLLDGDGGYRHSVALDGTALQAPESATRRSYDQGFALLALAELHRAAGGFEAKMEACWQFVVARLFDPATGALWEDDRGARGSRIRAQNPQMHMFEALLAAFEATGEAVWLDRAGIFARLAEARLIDPATGAVREFLGPDMDPLAGPEGTRREPGHQFEWAWLLRKHAALSGGQEGLRAARRMERFAQAHGLRGDGPLAGAPVAAIDAAGAVVEEQHLLWPLTEAGKVHAARAHEGDTASADRARAISATIFGRYFSPDGAPFWAMALDRAAVPTGEPGLTRLLYHVAIFVTEGARAGLWDLGARRNAPGEARPELHSTSSCRRRNNA